MNRYMSVSLPHSRSTMVVSISDSGKHHLHARKGRQDWQTSTPNVSVMITLIMREMTIRYRKSSPHSAAWFTWVTVTGLAHMHPSQEIACELPHYLRKMILVLSYVDALTPSPLNRNTPRYTAYSAVEAILNIRLKIPSRALSPSRSTTLCEKGTATR
jgi:hypothetical protein